MNSDIIALVLGQNAVREQLKIQVLHYRRLRI